MTRLSDEATPSSRSGQRITPAARFLAVVSHNPMPASSRSPSLSRLPRSASAWFTPSGRSAFERIIAIHQHLANQRRVTANTLGNQFEVSSRTIKRDIEFMRDRCGSPIEWDARRSTYYYTRPCEFLPLLRIDGHEALALSLASETFASWGGTPLGKALTSVFGKFAAVAGPHVSLPVSELSACLFNPDDNSSASEHLHFGRLLDAILQRSELTIAYQKPRATRSELRRVHPLHLAHLDHAWMLIAHDGGKNAWRSFLLSRIETLAPTGRTFAAVSPAKIRTHLRGSMGRFTGETEIEVRIRFSATLAPYIRERPWHPSQTLIERPDGEIETTLRLNNLIDVQRRILSCGSHAEALAPEELRETLRRELHAMLAHHEN